MNTLFSRRPIRFLLWIGGLVATSFCVSADAQQRTAPKTSNPTARLAPTPDSASQDFGHVAVLVDNGLMVTERNLFDLNGITLRFEPAGDGRYTLTRSTAVLDSEFGPALTFGYPGVTDYP